MCVGCPKKEWDEAMAASEIKPKFNIRVHLADNTIDLASELPKSSAAQRANLLVQSGIWVGERLYPSSAIVYIELIEVK